MPQKSGSTIFRKKPPDFLKFIGPATLFGFCNPLKSCIWSLRNLYYPSQFLQSQLGCLDGRGVPKNPGARFSEKNPGFLKFNGPVTTLWVLQPSQINHMVSPEVLPARAVFTRSNKVPGWQPGAPKFREHDLPKEILFF